MAWIPWLTTVPRPRVRNPTLSGPELLLIVPLEGGAGSGRPFPHRVRLPQKAGFSVATTTLVPRRMIVLLKSARFCIRSPFAAVASMQMREHVIRAAYSPRPIVRD
jgi:hypothetical protein